LVARAPSDGYTLLYATSSTLATSVYLSKTLPFDPVKDFSAINLMASPITAFLEKNPKGGQHHVCWQEQGQALPSR
jgi:tripartite-type tricarboxylate transporter receptor subunit TctC